MGCLGHRRPTGRGRCWGATKRRCPRGCRRRTRSRTIAAQAVMLYPARRRPRHRAPVGIGSAAPRGLHLEAGQQFRVSSLHGGCQHRWGTGGPSPASITRPERRSSGFARRSRPCPATTPCPTGFPPSGTRRGALRDSWNQMGPPNLMSFIRFLESTRLGGFGRPPPGPRRGPRPSCAIVPETTVLPGRTGMSPGMTPLTDLTARPTVAAGSRACVGPRFVEQPRASPGDRCPRETATSRERGGARGIARRGYNAPGMRSR